MPWTTTSEVVEFDADAAWEAAKATVPGTLRSCVEFNVETFNPLYIDDFTIAFYDSEEDMLAHFPRIHSYVNLDLAEVDLFTGELFPIAERVEYITTALDFFKMVRVDHTARASFSPWTLTSPVEPVVAAIQAGVRG